MKFERKSILEIIFFTTVIVLCFFLRNDVYAENVTSTNGITAEISYYNTLISNKKNVLISVQDKSKNEITKDELLNLYEGNIIGDVKTKNGNSLAAADKVKTGDIIVTTTGEYIAILAGDANEDGIICDTDDIMAIINDYLGKNTLTEENKIAANLQNTDESLDVDDVMRMINRYLGKQSNLLAQNLSAPSIKTISSKPANAISVSNGTQDYTFIVDFGCVASSNCNQYIIKDSWSDPMPEEQYNVYDGGGFESAQPTIVYYYHARNGNIISQRVYSYDFSQKECWITFDKPATKTGKPTKVLVGTTPFSNDIGSWEET